MTDDAMQIRNRHAIVMGATSGIGLEVARVLADRGWIVGIAGRRRELLDQIAGMTDRIVAAEVIDVNSADAPEALLRLIDRVGGMELYIHSSGVGFQNCGLDEDKELATVETNCLGMARMVGAVFRYMADRPDRQGQIAVISSIARTRGLGAAPAYSASKRFTSHYIESLEQLKRIRRIRHICLTDIRPGFVRTPFIAGSGFPCQMDAGCTARTVVDGIERRKTVVTVNGLYRMLVFFWQLIPRWLWIRMPVGRPKK